MSPKSTVRSPQPLSCAASARLTLHVSRFTLHPSRVTRHPSPATSHAFTLIEIMIVVAIMAIVMTMGVPIVYKVWHKAPLRKAVSDVVEVCSRARARAIMQGVKAEVIFHPKDGILGVSGGAAPPHPAQDAGGAADAIAPAPAGSGLSAHISDRVIIEMLDINMSGVEYNDADSAKITFYPNGTSDEMRMVLFDGRDRVGIELEITTGLANVVPNPLQEWTRR